MKPILHHPTTREWCLLSLTGMAMTAAIFLGEGQAGILSTPPRLPSINDQHSPPSGIMPKTSFSLISRDLQSTTITHYSQMAQKVAQTRESEKNLQKKKVGLAILFLGVLAENG
jgi:hypothetical protein